MAESSLDAATARGPLLHRVYRTDYLAGTGAVALSHGGGLRIVSLTGNAVQVAMDGACRGCPAAERTLRDGVLNDLRRVGIDVRVLGVAD